MRTLLLVWLVGGAAACFSPRYGNGDLLCSDDHRCPKGYHCVVTNTCWKDGENPPRLPGHLTAAGGSAVSISAPGTHAATISVGRGLAGSVSAPGNHTVQFGLVRSAVTR